MKDKVCLITGASSGIGKEAALQLAQKGAQVILICQNPQRGLDAQKEIQEKCGRPVDLFLGDLSLQKEIRRLAEEIRQKHEKIHLLLNNAGAYFARREETAEGMEKTFALNHISYFLLTHLLIDLLLHSAPARIVNVSSNLHHGKALDFEDLLMKKKYNGAEAYGRSKLANLYFTYELARRLEGKGVTVNALHPGFVATRIAANNGLLYRLGMSLLRPFQISVAKGARTSVYLSSSPEVEGVTGKYFYKNAPDVSSPQSHDEEAQKRLWKASEEWTGVLWK